MKKTVGDRVCKDVNCEDCVLNGFYCVVVDRYTLNKTLNTLLNNYPNLEFLRPVIEKELDKEWEDEN